MENSYLEKYYKSNRAAKAIYGIILTVAILAGIEYTNNGLSDIFIKLLLGNLVIVFAEIYSESIGEIIKIKSKISDEKRREIMSDAFAIMSVTLVPVAVFLLVYVGIISEDAAFNISYTALLFGLIFFSYLAGIAMGKNRKKP